MLENKNQLDCFQSYNSNSTGDAHKELMILPKRKISIKNASPEGPSAHKFVAEDTAGYFVLLPQLSKTNRAMLQKRK